MSASKRASPATVLSDTLPEPAPRRMSVFRRRDASMWHERCRQRLVLQGVRGGVEADFYCYACLGHVTVPLDALDHIPVVDDETVVANRAKDRSDVTDISERGSCAQRTADARKVRRRPGRKTVPPQLVTAMPDEE